VDAAVRQVRQNHVFHVSVGKEQNELAAKKLETFPEIAAVELAENSENVKVTLRDGQGDGSFIPQRLIHEGFRRPGFQEEELNLEDVFRRITKGITNAPWGGHGPPCVMWWTGPTRRGAMSARINCTKCGEKIELPAGFAKPKVRCADCGYYPEVPADKRTET